MGALGGYDVLEWDLVGGREEGEITREENMAKERKRERKREREKEREKERGKTREGSRNELGLEYYKL